MRQREPVTVQPAATWILLAGWMCLNANTVWAAEQKIIETISVGVITIAPYTMVGGDGAHGAIIDFFDAEIAPRMGVRFKWEAPVTIARLEQNLIAGRVLFTPLLMKTAARQQSGIQYSTDAYVYFNPCIALLPSHKLDTIRLPSDLYGLKIGWVQAGALSSFMHDEQIKLDLIGVIDWENANLAKLEAGRLDGVYFSNRYTPQYYAAQSGLRLKLLDLPVPHQALFGAFAPSTPAALIARYENAARQAFANGRFEQYIERALAKRAH
ncbi:MAG: transporter substrate-binding domain-containing protein [Pseudomonadota bacterium]